MKFKITESQLKKLMTQLDDKQEVAEDETAGEGGVDTNPDAAPKSGESTNTGKQTGAAKWPSHGQQPAEGPSNIKGNSKWASKNQQPARGAANDIAEQEQGVELSTAVQSGRSDGINPQELSPEYIEAHRQKYLNVILGNIDVPVKLPEGTELNRWAVGESRLKVFSTKADPNNLSSWYFNASGEKEENTNRVFYDAPTEEHLRTLFPDFSAKNFTTPDGVVWIPYITIYHPNLSSTHGPLKSYQELAQFLSYSKDKWLFNGFYDPKRNKYNQSVYFPEPPKEESFWDSWAGFAVQIGAAIVITVATAGIAGAIGATVGTAFLIEAGAQAGFNIYVGLDQMEHGNDFGATCSFIFAVVPVMGKLLGNSTNASAKAFGFATKEEIAEVIQKLDINPSMTPSEFAAKIERGINEPGLLSPRAKIALRKTLDFQPNQLVSGVKAYGKELTKELTKKNISLKQIKVNFLKKHSVKELGVILSTQVAAGAGKYYNEKYPSQAEQEKQTQQVVDKVNNIGYNPNRYTPPKEWEENPVTDEEASGWNDEPIAQDTTTQKQDTLPTKIATAQDSTVNQKQ
jgi:hypothetical protein